MRERIKRVMADAFRLSPSQLPDDARMADVPGWDSLGHLELMLALELEFGVQIGMEDMAALIGLPEIEEYLAARPGLEAA